MSQRKSLNTKSRKWLEQKLGEKDENEEFLFEEIKKRIGDTSEPVTEIATFIFHKGRKQLAMKFLNEVEVFEQIETLLQWSENIQAFSKALEDGNPEVICMVMLKLRERMAFETFLRMIRNFPLALTLYKKYCKELNVQNLYEIHVQEKEFEVQALTLLEGALKSPTSDSFLHSAKEAFAAAKNKTNASLCDEQLKLLTFQRQLNEKNTRHNFLGKTVQETCSLLLETDVKKAEQFRNVFKIPERRFWLLRVETLARLEQWANLERLSKRKCPIGFEVFVDVCLRKSKKEEALKYLSKVGKTKEVKYYIKMGFLEEAAEMAFEKNDRDSLLVIRSLCGRKSSLMEKVNSFIKTWDAGQCQMWHTFVA